MKGTKLSYYLDEARKAHKHFIKFDFTSILFLFRIHEITVSKIFADISIYRLSYRKLDPPYNVNTKKYF